MRPAGAIVLFEAVVDVITFPSSTRSSDVVNQQLLVHLFMLYAYTIDHRERVSPASACVGASNSTGKGPL